MFLGIDLGTSSVKVVLSDLSGDVIGEADAAYPVYGTEKRFFLNRDPADWACSILSAINTVRVKIPEEQWKSVEAIGLSAPNADHGAAREGRRSPGPRRRLVRRKGGGTGEKTA